MREYEYQCRVCETVSITTSHSTPLCSVCIEPMLRVYHFNPIRSMPEHFNNTLGEHVSNPRQFTDGLKRKSEEVSIRTGISHDFQPVDPADMRDMAAHGVTEEGLDETRRATFTKD